MNRIISLVASLAVIFIGTTACADTIPSTLTGKYSVSASVASYEICPGCDGEYILSTNEDYYRTTSVLGKVVSKVETQGAGPTVVNTGYSSSGGSGGQALVSLADGYIHLYAGSGFDNNYNQSILDARGSYTETLMFNSEGNITLGFSYFGGFGKTISPRVERDYLRPSPPIMNITPSFGPVGAPEYIGNWEENVDYTPGDAFGIWDRYGEGTFHVEPGIEYELSNSWGARATWGSFFDGMNSAHLNLALPEGMTYTSGSGVFLTEGLNAIGGNGNPPVPEPTTMLLFGTGLIGLAGVSRRKKK